MKRVVIFARVSTTAQDFERQINQLKDYCKSNDLIVVKDFSEKISGAKSVEERKAFKECIDFVLNSDNEIDGLCVHELSRVSRSIATTAQAIEDLHRNKKWVFSLKDNIYTLNLNDLSVNSNAILITTLLSALAQNELDTLKFRVKSGIEDSVFKNKNCYGGKAPYGYDRLDSKFIIVEHEANVIRKIFDLYLNQNMGCMQIAKYLNENNIQTRHQQLNKSFKLKGKEFSVDDLKWSDGTVYSLLNNKLIKGIRLYKKTTEIEIPECIIIEPEIFDAVQNKLKSNYNKKGINTKFSYIINSDSIKCACCGLSYFPHKRLNGNDNAYKCLSHRYNYKGGKCGNVAINIDKLSNLIWKVVRNTDDLVAQLEDNKRNNSFQKQYDVKNAEFGIKTSEFAKVVKDEAKLIDLYLNNLLNKDTYTLKFRNLQLQKNTLDFQLKRISNELRELQQSIDDLNDLDTQIRTIKENPDMMKNEYVSKIVKNVIMHPVKDDFKLSDYKGDKAVIVQINLFTSLKSNYFVISQRSKKYIELFEEEIDLESGIINKVVLDNRRRLKDIPTVISI